MRRASNVVLGLAMFLALIVAAYFVGQPSTIVTTTTTGAKTNAFYLVVGGSASLGTQPTGVATDNGHRTLNGYANDVVMIEHGRGVYLNLYHVGCPGETVETMLDVTGGDRCNTPPVTQLSRAVRFLVRHRDEAGVVSIDLGLNDIRPCLSHLSVGEPCAAYQTKLIAQDLPVIVRELQHVAGPRVRLIGFEYEDPFLERYLDGEGGPALASNTLVAIDHLNATLAQVYGAAKVAIANIPQSFQNDNATPVTIDNVGPVPENVEEICQLTWMCQPAPFGPDDHPNNEGYMAIAEAVVANLPPSTW